MKIKTTVEGLGFNDLVDLLSLFDSGGHYWIEVMNWNDDEYKASKESVKVILERNYAICIEHVWAEMLLMGYSLWITDEDGEKWRLDLNKVINGLERYFELFGVKDIDEMDADDGDLVFQLALFGEVIYG